MHVELAPELEPDLAHGTDVLKAERLVKVDRRATLLGHSGEKRVVLKTSSFLDQLFLQSPADTTPAIQLRDIERRFGRPIIGRPVRPLGQGSPPHNLPIHLGDKDRMPFVMTFEPTHSFFNRFGHSIEGSRG